MKIVSIIKREGGSLVTVGGTDYLFAPDETGEHVCDVADENHAERLLSIKEGYCAVNDEVAADPAKVEGEAKAKGGRKSKQPVADTKEPPAADPAKVEGEA